MTLLAFCGLIVAALLILSLGSWGGVSAVAALLDPSVSACRRWMVGTLGVCGFFSSVFLAIWIYVGIGQGGF